MHRREFIGTALASATSAAAATTSWAASEKDTRSYELIFYQFRIGEQSARMRQWAEKTLVPVAKKHGIQALGCFQLELGVDSPQLMVLVEHASLAQMQSRWEAMDSDPAWNEGLSTREAGQSPPFEKAERRWLRATDYSPPLTDAVGKAKSPRFFELRVYHSPTLKQLRALHERFSGPEIQIFHRTGIHPILYAETLFGPDMPNLTYLTPFESLEAREKAWQAFREDPEWQKVRAESVAKAGEIVSYTSRLIFTAAPYSPIF